MLCKDKAKELSFKDCRLMDVCLLEEQLGMFWDSIACCSRSEQCRHSQDLGVEPELTSLLLAVGWKPYSQTILCWATAEL